MKYSNTGTYDTNEYDDDIGGDLIFFIIFILIFFIFIIGGIIFTAKYQTPPKILYERFQEKESITK